MPSFSRFFKNKDGSSGSSKSRKGVYPSSNDPSSIPQKPQWVDAWQRKSVEPEEVQELLRGCTQELKSRGLNLPFLLLPFRPNADPTGARTFLRNYFGSDSSGGIQLHGEYLSQELRLTEPIVLCTVMKWCWSRLPGGVVTWEAYELFKVGEQDSNMARDSFTTFLPISIDSEARTKIIFDFFDLMASIAAHAKSNGLGGRKLSRLAGWWAFEHRDGGNGFEGGYKSWASAADATSHLFFAYLRSLSPNSVRGTNGISTLPMSLQSLVQATEYPPETPSLMQSTTSKIVMVVDSVSPTPFALLRRAKNFEYRDDDPSLQAFASYQDPVDTLTEECRRVLNSISSTNQSAVTTTTSPSKKQDASWSRFEDMGFSGMTDDSDHEPEGRTSNLGGRNSTNTGLRSTPQSRMQDMGRPTTPSWADFLSSGFADEPGNAGPAPLLLPPDKVLPPIDTDRVRSSQSHRRLDDSDLEPGELASIAKMDLDDSFWWVWITSLAGEELPERKAVFGRCALIETSIQGARWLVIEEMVKGAAPAIEEGAYIVEKKSRFGLSKKSRLTRRKSTGKKLPVPDRDQPYRSTGSVPMSKTSIGPDQHARIQAAAAALQQKQKSQEEHATNGSRRGRMDDARSTKTNSVMTLQPMELSEASQAMKWAKKYDKDAIREEYLANTALGRGANGEVGGHRPEAAKPEPATSNSASRQTPVGASADTPDTPIKDIEKPALAVGPEPPMSSHPAHGDHASSSTAAAQPSTAPSRKPLPKIEQPPSPVHKEYPELTDLEREANAAALRSQGSTPEKPGAGKKLKKRHAEGGASGGGLKKLFGRKKAEKTMPAPGSNGDVFESKSAGPQQSTLTRRLSKLGKKESSSAKSSAMHTPDQETASATNPILERSTSSDMVKSHSQHEEYADAHRHGGLPEQGRPKAKHTPIQIPNQAGYDTHPAYSSTFNQGPLEDNPAFVPDGPTHSGNITPMPNRSESTTPQPEHSNGSAAAKPGAPVAAVAPAREASPPTVLEPKITNPDPVISPVSPIEPAKAAPPAPLQREKSAEEKAVEERETTQQQQDRWAQIRKHAAERAAARSNSDDQSKPSQSRSEDGETSGEETIESRVARIKARVAELTGNMDPPPAAKT